jgi:DNA-binding NarL/FixJ family response regulator
MNELVRVLLVDDQPLVRTGLRRILALEEGFDVVGECTDGSEVAAAVALTRPHVVLMDVRMRHMSGAEATQLLRRQPDTPPVLVLTTYRDDEVLAAALRAGAAGFLLKDAPGEEIVRATKIVAAGESYLDPSVTARVLDVYRSSAPRDARSSRLRELTARELEVLRLIGQGLSNEEIADGLVIGEATVKTHISRIFDKLEVRDRATAIVLAFEEGLVTPGMARAGRRRSELPKDSA